MDKRAKRAEGRGGAREAPRAIFVALAALAAVGAIALVVALAIPQSLTVGFYDVDSKLETKMKGVIDAWARGAGVKVAYRGSSVEALEPKSLRRIDALILYPSIINEEKAELFATLPDDLAGTVAPSLRDSIAAAGRSWALPLLIDTRELAWRSDLLPAGSASARTGLGGLDAIGGRMPKKAPPLAAAGGIDVELIDIAGLFVVDRGGLEAYETLARRAREGGSDAALDADLGGFSLRDALAPLFQLQERERIHPNWLELEEADLVGVVEARLAGLSLQTLSLHRAIRRDELASWDSAAISRRSDGGLPVVTSSVVSIARLKASRAGRAIGQLCGYLMSAEGQRALQLATGLAPSAASTPAIDVQASGSRVAASAANVVQGLSRDGFSSTEERGEFAAALRACLRSSPR